MEVDQYSGIRSILSEGKLMGWIKLFFFVWWLILVNNSFVWGEKFLDFSWWILSFNFLLLVTLAVATFRKEVFDYEKNRMASMLEKVNTRLQDEIKEKNLKNKIAIHKEIDDVYDVSKSFPRNLILYSITISVLFTMMYLAVFTVSYNLINQLIFKISIVNIILITSFILSFFFLIKAVINMIFFFLTKDKI